jgi:hypothetical protein
MKQEKYPSLLKDVNFIEMNRALVETHLINLEERDSQALRDTISKDCIFLANNGIMDYSLFLVIEKGA